MLTTMLEVIELGKIHRYSEPTDRTRFMLKSIKVYFTLSPNQESLSNAFFMVALFLGVATGVGVTLYSMITEEPIAPGFAFICMVVACAVAFLVSPLLARFLSDKDQPSN
jgi:hypothetical protein